MQKRSGQLNRIYYSILFWMMLFLSACSPAVVENADLVETASQKIEELKTEDPWNGVLIENGDFIADVSAWDVPYGKLEHSFESYFSAPGGGIAITNDTSGSVGFRTSFGQCVDLRKLLEASENQSSTLLLELSAVLRTGSKITEITLDGIFLKDTRCGTGHVGSFDRILLESIPDWTEIKTAAIVPETAKSLHVFFSAVGIDESARFYIDDVILVSPELESD